MKKSSPTTRPSDRFVKPYVLAACGLFFGAGLASGAILFQDSFESPPETVGSAPTLWTASNPSAITVNSADASDGSNSLFLTDGSTRTITLIDAVVLPEKSQALVLSWDYKPLSSFENGDGLIGISIDFGSGYQVLLSDEGAADPGAYIYAGSELTLSDTASLGGLADFVSYSVNIDQSYYAAATEFRLRFVTNGGAGPEDIRLDNIQVNSINVAPEPSSLGLIGLGGLLIANLRRRLSTQK